MKAKTQTINQQRAELEQKAVTIANLMSQLHSMRKKQQSAPLQNKEEEASTSSADSSPRVPAPPKDGTPRHPRRRSSGGGRRTSDNPILQNAVIPRAASGRRLSTPPNSSGSDNLPDPSPFLTKRHVPAESVPTVARKSKPAVLPPITQSSNSIAELSVREHYSRLAKKYPSKRVEKRVSQSSSPEVETLAVEQVSQEGRLREAHHYQSTD